MKAGDSHLPFTSFFNCILPIPLPTPQAAPDIIYSLSWFRTCEHGKEARARIRATYDITSVKGIPVERQ